MVYAAIALALVGAAVGLVFRLKILLPVLGLLLIVSVVFSLDRGFSFLDTALTIMVVTPPDLHSDRTLEERFIVFGNLNRTSRWPHLCAQGTAMGQSPCRQQ